MKTLTKILTASILALNLTGCPSEEKVQDSVHSIESRVCETQGQETTCQDFQGTGFAFEQKGLATYILTNRHVIQPHYLSGGNIASSVEVNGKRATIEKISNECDLALLKVYGSLAHYDNFKIGMNEGQCGIIHDNSSEMGTCADNLDEYTITTSFQGVKGQSGSPVFTYDGKSLLLSGVLTKQSGKSVSYEKIKEFLSE